MTITPIDIEGGTAVRIDGPDGPTLLVAERDGMIMWVPIPRRYRQIVANTRSGKARTAKRAALADAPRTGG